VFDVPSDTAQNYYIEGLPFGTRGGMLIKYQFPVDVIHVQGEGPSPVTSRPSSSDRRRATRVTVDGERVKLFDWIANQEHDRQWSRDERVPVRRPAHWGVTFLATNDVPGTELNKAFRAP